MIPTPLRLSVLAVLLSPVLASACQVPVFRYALERWPADVYELAVFYRGELDAEQGELVDEVGGHANVRLVPVDLSAVRPGELGFYGGVEVAEGQVLARLFFPPEARIEEPIWEGEFTRENYQRLVDSPVRRQLIGEILAGESAVWVILESGDGAKDDRFERDLRAHLEATQGWLEIPEGVVGPGSVDRVATGEVAMEDVLRSEIPLHISFEVLRIRRGDPAEEIFEKILLGGGALPEGAAGEPLAFPVFGRARTIDGLPASRLSKDVIDFACSYLCGACSCEVKRENPGFDLLCTADWGGALEGSAVVVDKALPALDGVGDLVAAPPDPPRGDDPAAAPGPGSAGGSGGGETPGFGSPLLTNMLWLCGGLFLTLMLVTFFMKRTVRG